jgi:hypothetical protein
MSLSVTREGVISRLEILSRKMRSGFAASQRLVRA